MHSLGDESPERLSNLDQMAQHVGEKEVKIPILRFPKTYPSHHDTLLPAASLLLRYLTSFSLAYTEYPICSKSLSLIQSSISEKGDLAI